MTPEPEWVDLGLPSGLLWAKANLGATRPESDGIYFSWGNVDGHPAGAGYNFDQESYHATPGADISDNLTLDHDAARANLGSPWRMPSSNEFQELVDSCSSVWTTLNGVVGRLFTSNVNGNTLFFPAAGLFSGTSLNFHRSRGYYWSSTWRSVESARDMRFESSTLEPQDFNNRIFGFSIRAVRPA